MQRLTPRTAGSTPTGKGAASDQKFGRRPPLFKRLSLSSAGARAQFALAAALISLLPMLMSFYVCTSGWLGFQMPREAFWPLLALILPPALLGYWVLAKYPATVESLSESLLEVERKQAAEAMRQSAADLHALAARLQDVREEERATLSRELHDTLGQQLTAFALQFEVLSMDSQALVAENPGLADQHEKLAGMAPLVGRLIERTQSLCATLRPGLLDELGLAAAIEWLADKMTSRPDMVCTASLPSEDFTVDRNIALALFRITQESLSNVARHAQATRVEIMLHAADNDLELEIHDNGRGFAPKSCLGAKALGLLGMIERAAAFGGTVDFLSEPGKGTTVRVRMPGGTWNATGGACV